MNGDETQMKTAMNGDENGDETKTMNGDTDEDVVKPKPKPMKP